jgi:GTP-binding protein
LASVSRTLPKIASYPFTTLTPNIGIIKFIDDYKYTICDLPGIIENSFQNKGLGLQFLRHIERTPILVFVLDAMDEEPWYIILDSFILF